jgi:hypothetical protein
MQNSFADYFTQRIFGIKDLVVKKYHANSI